MKALHEQELCNQHLRKYIDGILLRVVELYPEILEVASSSSRCSSPEASTASTTLSTARSPEKPNDSVFGSLRAALAYASFRKPPKPSTSPTFTSEQWSIPEEPRSRSVDGEAPQSLGSKLYSYLPSARFFRRSPPKDQKIELEAKEGEEIRPSPPPPDPVIK
uniref:FIP-RBD domain-containing protein n=1 Tax=Bursaphelenchus xylophilus TaxID=6326 RepID=A0A1I7SGX5_BURXY